MDKQEILNSINTLTNLLDVLIRLGNDDKETFKKVLDKLTTLIEAL